MVSTSTMCPATLTYLVRTVGNTNHQTIDALTATELARALVTSPTHTKGKHHDQKKKQSRVPQKKSRATTKQPPLPLVQQSPSNRSRPPNPIRPSRRRHRTRTSLQNMQLKKRRTIRQRQQNSSSPRKSRTPRTRPNNQTKNKTTTKFFYKRKNYDPVPFFALIWTGSNRISSMSCVFGVIARSWDGFAPS